jgi:hypothetical protein
LSNYIKQLLKNKYLIDSGKASTFSLCSITFVMAIVFNEGAKM